MFVAIAALYNNLYDFLAVVLFNRILNTKIVPPSLVFSIFEKFLLITMPVF